MTNVSPGSTPTARPMNAPSTTSAQKTIPPSITACSMSPMMSTVPRPVSPSLDPEELVDGHREGVEEADAGRHRHVHHADEHVGHHEPAAEADERRVPAALAAEPRERAQERDRREHVA